MSNFAILPLALVIASPARLSAQERVLRDPGAVAAQPGVLATAPAIQVIRRGEGAGPPVPDLGQALPDPPPPQLTSLEKTALVAGLGTLDLSMGPWLVDVQKPYIQQASLMIWRSNMVDSRIGWANLPGIPSARVVLSFTPPNPNRTYLVHCSATESGTYTVKASDSQAEVTLTNTPIQFVYAPAGETGEEWFTITRYASGGFAWNFYGCDITALQG
jgi:hypothetical protein